MVEHDEAVPLRLGIIGCGWISDWHGRAAAGTPGVEIVACCDARAEAASAFKQHHGCERDYADYRVMLAEHQLDGVILATWPPHHLEQALACLEAGIKTILCEKSLTTSGQDALAMFTAAQAAGALVVEGFMYRHHPAMRQVDELLSAGELGVIDNVGAGFEDFDPEEPGPNDPRDWRQRKELGGGVPYDLACYCVNACNHVAGALPTQVMAITRRSSRYDTVHRMYGLIEYENGVVGRITSSKKSNVNWGLTVSGSTGHLFLPIAWTPNALPPREGVDEGEFTELLIRRSTGIFSYRSESIAIPAADPYLVQMHDFVATVRGEREPEPTLAESAVNVITIDALLRSAEERTTVPVEVPDVLQREIDGVVSPA